jgi:hypothetical protein
VTTWPAVATAMKIVKFSLPQLVFVGHLPRGRKIGILQFHLVSVPTLIIQSSFVGVGMGRVRFVKKYTESCARANVKVIN